MRNIKSIKIILVTSVFSVYFSRKPLDRNEITIMSNITVRLGFIPHGLELFDELQFKINTFRFPHLPNSV